VAVSGSTGRDVDGRIVPGGPYAQARQAIENLQTALAAVGGGLADVIRTRVFVVDMSDWEAVAKAHCEAFAEHPPASSLIGVSALFEPDVLVEIEADAILSGP
jgi:enamine deaminase RidA (YjgF/YER057c/UK114 family)